jgi:hypothetical protein
MLAANPCGTYSLTAGIASFARGIILRLCRLIDVAKIIADRCLDYGLDVSFPADAFGLNWDHLSKDTVPLVSDSVQIFVFC